MMKFKIYEIIYRRHQHQNTGVVFNSPLENHSKAIQIKGKTSCGDLRGGHRMIGVPTATIHKINKLAQLDMYTICTYTYNMNVEWDPRKALENLRKHNVDFADAVIVLENENVLTIEDKDHDEQRFKTLGIGPSLNIL